MKERLLEAKKQQEENRKLCGRAYNKEYLGYVCVDVIGNLIKPNYVSSTFGKLLAKNNLRHIRFHDLRHTCASLLLANGVPMEQVKEWLGHSEISTTVDIYGHLQYATKNNPPQPLSRTLWRPCYKTYRRFLHKRKEVYQLFAGRPHGGDGEIRTLAPVLSRPTAFRVRTLQPLGYISKFMLYPWSRPADQFSRWKSGRTTG